MPDLDSKKKWDKENTSIITLKLNNNTDKDIINHLEGKPKQTEIKKLIRSALAQKE